MRCVQVKRSIGEPYYITIELANERCKVLRTLDESGVSRFRIIDVRAVDGEVTRHLVRMASEEIFKIPESISVKRRSGGKTELESSVWIDTKGCDVCSTILSSGSFLISGRNIEENTLIYHFIVPNFEAFRKITSTLEAKGLKHKILEVGRLKSKGKILTEKQERVLWIALRMGFFEYPRKVNTQELSRRLGISMSTLSEITRRGMRRLLEDHFEI